MIYSSLPAGYFTLAGNVQPLQPRSPARPAAGRLLDSKTGDGLLTTQEAGQLLGISPRTLEGYRRKGGGPQFVALSRNVVRYRRADLVAWLEGRIAPHTAKARALLAA